MVEYNERSKNSEADELAKGAVHNMPLPADVFFQVIADASVKIVKPDPRLINLIEGKYWHAPIMVYLYHYYEIFPSNRRCFSQNSQVGA
jgi:hypothetical protein